MAWPVPKFSKNQVNKAGHFFVESSKVDIEDVNLEQQSWAFEVLDNWRSCHGYLTVFSVVKTGDT